MAAVDPPAKSLTCLGGVVDNTISQKVKVSRSNPVAVKSFDNHSQTNFDFSRGPTGEKDRDGPSFLAKARAAAWPWRRPGAGRSRSRRGCPRP